MQLFQKPVLYNSLDEQFITQYDIDISYIFKYLLC